MEAEEQAESGLGERIDLMCSHAVRLCPLTQRCHPGRRKVPYRLAYDIGQLVAIAEADRIRFAHGLTHDAILGSGAFVRPDEYVAQQIHAVQLVDSQRPFDVGPLRYVHEGERAKIRLDEWNVRSEAGCSLVHVRERLEVGNVYHHEERLLEWIGYRRRLLEQEAEVLFDWRSQRKRSTIAWHPEIGHGESRHVSCARRALLVANVRQAIRVASTRIELRAGFAIGSIIGASSD